MGSTCNLWFFFIFSFPSLSLGKMPNNKKTAGKRAPAKRKLAEVFGLGEVLADISRKEWKLGAPIGQGGFGRLYLGKCNYL